MANFYSPAAYIALATFLSVLAVSSRFLSSSEHVVIVSSPSSAQGFAESPSLRGESSNPLELWK